MPAPISLDELLSKRQGQIRSTDRGDALVKAFKAPPSWNKEARTAKFIMSAEVQDRHGDVVVQAGLDTAEFEKNPVALAFHNHAGWPIGKWTDITKVSGKPRRTEGVLNFAPEGVDETADKAAAMVDAGLMRCVSIGFIPKEYEPLYDANERWTGIKFLAAEMIECSLVPIPANPAAVAKAAGGDIRVHMLMLEEILDEWARTPEGLVVPREVYEREYRAVKTTANGGVPIPASLAGAIFGPASNASDTEKAAPEPGIEAVEATGVLKALKTLADTITEALRGLAPAEKVLSEVENREIVPETASEDVEASEVTEKAAENAEIRENPEIEVKAEPEPPLPSETDIALAKARAKATLARLRTQAAA